MYLYNDKELDELAKQTRAFHGKVRKVFTKFNNHYALRGRLGQEAPDPEALRATWQPPRRPPRPRQSRETCQRVWEKGSL